VKNNHPIQAASPIAFAHRGASAYAPENTIEAFTLALGQGATGLESDAWLAADGIPMLVHDLTVRPSGRRIDVTRTRAANLAHWGVPTLAELYAACGTGFDLSLDLEHPQVALPVLRMAAAAGAAIRLWACHDDLGLLAELRAASTELRLVCSTRPRRTPEGVDARIDGLGPPTRRASAARRGRRWPRSSTRSVARRASRATGSAFHQHAGTFVETPDEPDRLVELTREELVGICLDVGH
jgi:hypothetical protein